MYEPGWDQYVQDCGAAGTSETLFFFTKNTFHYPTSRRHARHLTQSINTFHNSYITLRKPSRNIPFPIISLLPSSRMIGLNWHITFNNCQKRGSSQIHKQTSLLNHDLYIRLTVRIQAILFLLSSCNFTTHLLTRLSGQKILNTLFSNTLSLCFS
jgi:hypothetical protein